jgi:predicted ATPase
LNFKNKTNWVAITGAPSSGKTSVINVLAARGFHVQPETARAVIERRLAGGETLERIRADNTTLQYQIMHDKIALEAGLDPGARVFLDRGMPDSISYFRLFGIDVADPVAESRRNRYAAVFLFDPLPMVHDAVRSEDPAVAIRLDRDIEADYRMLGYDVVRVPVMPVEARADFIIARLGP